MHTPCVSFPCLRNVFLLCAVYFIARSFISPLSCPCFAPFHSILSYSTSSYFLYGILYNLFLHSYSFYIILFFVLINTSLHPASPLSFTFSLLSVTFNDSLTFILSRVSSIVFLFFSCSYHILTSYFMLVLSSILYTFKCYRFFSPLVFNPTLSPSVFFRPILLRILTFFISQFYQ